MTRAAHGGALTGARTGALKPRKSVALASERRDRVRCRVPIDIELGSGSRHAGVSRDLSETGVFIITELMRPAGTLLELALHLPGRPASLACVGEVRWQREAAESGDAPPGMGLRFLLLEPEVRRAIQEFLLTRAPVYSDG